MNLIEFTDRVINQGIEAAKEDYKDSPDKLRGSLAGFEACRGKNPGELAELLLRANRDTQEAFHRADSGNGGDNFWEIKCRAAEIEWVCNVVSAVLVQNGFPAIVPVTCGGVLAANRIISSEGTIVLLGEEHPYSDGNSVMSG